MVETLVPYNQEIITAIPVSIAFIGWLWRLVREERNKLDGTPIEEIEVHHKKRKWQGGKDTKDNLVGLTKIEHAEDHYRAAKKASGKARRNEYGAVRLITKRMSDEDRENFNKRINE